MFSGLDAYRTALVLVENGVVNSDASTEADICMAAELSGSSRPESTDDRMTVRMAVDTLATPLELTMERAIALIESLHHGDRVQVITDGRIHEMTVVGRPARSDGPFGEAESVGVQVTLGSGKWSTRVQAGNLVRTRRGRGYVGGGTVLVKVAA